MLIGQSEPPFFLVLTFIREGFTRDDRIGGVEYDEGLRGGVAEVSVLALSAESLALVSYDCQAEGLCKVQVRSNISVDHACNEHILTSSLRYFIHMPISQPIVHN